MNIVICVLIIIFLLIFQLSFLSFVLPFYLVPNIILSILICSLLFTNQIKIVLIYGFFAGILFDMFSGNIVGFSALSFLLIIFLLAFLKRKLAIKSGLNAFWLFLIIASLLYDLLIYVAIKIYPATSSIHWSTLTGIAMFGGILANLIFGSLIYFLWRRLLVSSFRA